MTKRMSGFLTAALLVGTAVSGAARAQQPAANDAPPISGLVPDHATLSVENLDVEQQWYTRVLGFKILRKMDSNPDMINEQLAIPGYRIDLIKYKGSIRPPAGSTVYNNQGWVHVVFHVQSVAKAVAELDALHVKPFSVNKENGVPIQILLRDPENNEVEVRRIDQ